MSITQEQMNALKVGDTVTVAFDDEVRTGKIGRVDDQWRPEFAFEGFLNVVYEMAWITEVTA